MWIECGSGADRQRCDLDNHKVVMYESRGVYIVKGANDV